tara:strand:+ start:3906 stop:4163 length:258 start_codon:yes stop_codon:yes gene_type:complete
MPYVNKPRPYKKEYAQQMSRGEHENRMERQRARRALDKKGVDRDGKDVSHKKMLSKGGSNKDGYKLESPSKNRSRNGKKPAANKK